MYMVLFLFAQPKKAPNTELVFPLLKVNYFSKKPLEADSSGSAATLILTLCSSFHFYYDPQPMLEITLNQHTINLLFGMGWKLEGKPKIIIELPKYLNVPVCQFCDGDWEFGAKRVTFEKAD